MARAAERNREKVSTTLPPALIRLVEEYQQEANLPSFSAAVEQLLWRELLEEKTRAYYLTLSQEDREEQHRWAHFATAQASETLPRE